MRGAACHLLLIAASLGFADERDPVAHWKLDRDAKDSSANRLLTVNHGVKFAADGKAASFDGIGSRLEVKSSRALRLGTGDFTLAFWVNAPETSDDDRGDLISMYDSSKRVGFNLSLRTNTGVTT